jgi:DHA1 family vesicular acetylcholine transporter-like MFS transporter 3
MRKCPSEECRSSNWFRNVRHVRRTLDRESESRTRNYRYTVADLQAPPIGGSLYTHFGWNAPFIFCITLCCVDLLARLFVIEQRDLPKYGLVSIKEQESAEQRSLMSDEEREEEDEQEECEELSLFGVIKALGSNRRGMTGVVMTAIFGLVDGALDPT